MKRLFSVLLTLIMAISALCCAAAEGADVTGVWYLSSLETDGAVINSSLLGMSMTLTLNEDSTAAMSVDGVEAPVGTWELKGDQVIITSDDEEMTADVVDGTLVISEASLGGNLTFTREEPVQQNLDLGEARTNVALDDFAGSWDTVSFIVADTVLPMEALNMDVKLVIEGNQATVTSYMGEEIDSEYSVQIVLENGVLSIPGDDSADAELLQFKLMEDGMLVCEQEMEGNLIALCFEKAE